MTQPVSTTNFLLHDANGQAQVIKVVQTSGKQAGGSITRTSLGSTVVRTPSGVIKSVSSPATSNLMHIKQEDEHTPIIRSTNVNTPMNKQRIVSLHGSNTQSAGIKVMRGSDPTKTLLLTQSQVNAIANQDRIKSVVNSNNKRSTNDTDHSLSIIDYKRRRADKLGKGLRHFSMKVCEKVRQKGTTSYNEVADELVAEFTGTPFKPNQDQVSNYDQKNIRRRVYDALNVLMAMNIISKEKKEIRWIGLPTSIVQANRNVEREKKIRLERIKQKTQDLHNLILQQIAFKNLVDRNRTMEKRWGRPVSSSVIQLPFLVVNTSQDTMINCSISNDKTEYLFNFDDKFEIQDDIHVLKGMGMMMGLDVGQCTSADLAKAKKMVPRSLSEYVGQMSGTLYSQLDTSVDGDAMIMETTGGGEDEPEQMERSSSPELPSPVVEYLDESEMRQMRQYMEDDSDTASDTELEMH